MTAPGQLIAFRADGALRYGLAAGDGVVDLWSRNRSRWPTLREAIADNGLRALMESGAGDRPSFPLDEIRFAIPIPAPEKIICVGVNYPERNEEYKDGQAASAYPSLFVRFPRSFVGHLEPIVRPRDSAQFDYEGEIALIVGKEGRRVAEKDALRHVAAVTLANDGTLRDWVRHAKFNVTQGKNFDRSGSIGPGLSLFSDEAQIADIRLTTRVNGELRQSDRSSRMTFGVRRLIAYISTFTTLVSGDVILTGTPTGAGARHDPPVWLKPGDVVEVEADRLGVLRNAVADEAEPRQ